MNDQSVVFRIFLASPGDVSDERELARTVIDQIRHERAFKDRLNIECIAWDQPGAEVAMEATMTPQMAIDKGLPKPSECDLVVVILWSRMGTPLSLEYTKPDGSIFESGTEWEYHDAITAAKQSGKPKVWVYRRIDKPLIEIDDPDFKKKQLQWNKVESFFKDFASEDGSLTGGVNSYQTENDFKSQFKGHLRDYLTTIVDSLNNLSHKNATGKEFNHTKGYAKSQQPSDAELEKEIQSYCQKAESFHATLPVAGFATQLKVPIDIEEIYVALRAMMDLRGVNEGCFTGSNHAVEVLNACDSGLEISIWEAFHQTEHRGQRGIVILGDPGSGKTTHLKRLLLWCLRNGSEKLGLLKEMIPIFLPLRELKNLSKGLDEFIQDQLQSPHLNTKEKFGERMLKRGHLLFLLDGLDEVAEVSVREQVTRWIEGGLRAYPTCRFVVTCRFAGYSPTVHFRENFLEMHLRPLAEEQMKEFIHNWYRVVEKGLSKDPEQAEGIASEKATKLVECLMEPDFRARRVFELTRNPLLLTNICLVDRNRGSLPRRRARLYEECIDVLLERWRVAKNLDIGATAQESRRALQPAALWLHLKEGRTRATTAELAPHIAPVLKAMNFEGRTAKEFLKGTMDESGLLTCWDQENYGFIHLGFQEYLAAREIRNRAFKEPEILSELASHFGESWWQEVTLLLLALEDPSLFEPYMEELIKQVAFAENPELVDMCLDEASEVHPSPFLKLIQEPPSDNIELWNRQMAGLRVLMRLIPEVNDEVKNLLIEHPYRAIRQSIQRLNLHKTVEIVVNIEDGYEMVMIPEGEYLMGSPENEKGRNDIEGPQHKVNLREYYLGRFPVTNEQYTRFLESNPNVAEPLCWADRKFNQSKQPVVGVSWYDARNYAKWAGLRLPSEAEWEYACRAGTTTCYYTGNSANDLDRTGWYRRNSKFRLHPVGEKEVNKFGLYDMHGNVWEWVEDDFHDSYIDAPDDGSAWINQIRGDYRVFRGGCWSNEPRICRSAYRSFFPPHSRFNFLGFRLAKSVEPED